MRASATAALDLIPQRRDRLDRRTFQDEPARLLPSLLHFTVLGQRGHIPTSVGDRPQPSPIAEIPWLETLTESSGKRGGTSASADGKPRGTSGSIQGLGYLLTALRRQGLIPDELVLQLATFLRSHDLFLELRVRTPRTLTANQVRHGGKQGTDRRELSRIHFSACLALTSLLRSLRPKD
jgi:hypothetical protein